MAKRIRFLPSSGSLRLLGRQQSLLAQQARGPFDLPEGQRRNGLICLIAQAPAVRSGIVTAIENGLEIQGHRRIAGEQWNQDLWQAVLQTDGVDDIVFQIVEVVDADVV